jgi:hypothetical protein
MSQPVFFCGSADDVIEFERRTICGSCKEK